MTGETGPEATGSGAAGQVGRRAYRSLSEAATGPSPLARAG